jgi:hypothetical protein
MLAKRRQFIKRVGELTFTIAFWRSRFRSSLFRFQFNGNTVFLGQVLSHLQCRQKRGGEHARTVDHNGLLRTRRSFSK